MPTAGTGAIGPRFCAEIAERHGEPLGPAPTQRPGCCSSSPARGGPDVLDRIGLPARLAALGIRPLLVRRSPRRYTPERLTCIAAWTGRDGPWMERHSLGSVDDVDRLSRRAGRGPRARPGAAVRRPRARRLTHGRRDACCAIRGRALATALAAADPEATWSARTSAGTGSPAR